MKMLLFKPELGILKIINYPEDGSIIELVKYSHFEISQTLIDGVMYNLYVGSRKVDSKRLWSFYKKSTDVCLYGNIVIEALNSADITAEDILRIKSHIVVNPKGYMIYIE